MSRSRGRKPRRVIVDIAHTPGRAAAAIEFHAPLVLVTVELGPRDRSAGPIAGVEGVGSELFFDATGRLFALELSPPLTDLRVSPAAELRSATVGGRPGELLARELPTGSLGGVAAVFTRPFGAALFVFEKCRTADADLVELADGIVASVARETGTLQSIWVAGFNRRQRVLGDPVSIERDGAAFIESLTPFTWSSSPAPPPHSPTGRARLQPPLMTHGSNGWSRRTPESSPSMPHSKPPSGRPTNARSTHTRCYGQSPAGKYAGQTRSDHRLARADMSLQPADARRQDLLRHARTLGPTPGAASIRAQGSCDMSGWRGALAAVRSLTRSRQAPQPAATTQPNEPTTR